MTVEQLLQRLVALSQEGRAQYEIRYTDLWISDVGDIIHSADVETLRVDEEKKEIVLV